MTFYIPDGYGRWLLTEMDADEFNRAYGLYDLSLGCPELGYVSTVVAFDLAPDLGPIVH